MECIVNHMCIQLANYAKITKLSKLIRLFDHLRGSTANFKQYWHLIKLL